jgi:hypothetical protein
MDDFLTEVQEENVEGNVAEMVSKTRLTRVLIGVILAVLKLRGV